MTPADDQLRRNLRLTPTQRVEKMLQLREEMMEMRGAALPEARRAQTLAAIDALVEGPARSA